MNYFTIDMTQKLKEASLRNYTRALSNGHKYYISNNIEELSNLTESELLEKLLISNHILTNLAIETGENKLQINKCIPDPIIDKRLFFVEETLAPNEKMEIFIENVKTTDE